MYKIKLTNKAKKILTVSTGQKSGERQHLGGIDEELLTLLERVSLDLVGQLDGDEEVAKSSENLVDLADLIKILKGSINLSYFSVQEQAD
jgi:hypothetical protein